MWSPVTCPVRDVAAGLAGLKDKEVATDERCEELAAGLCELELRCMYKKKGSL